MLTSLYRSKPHILQSIHDVPSVFKRNTSELDVGTRCDVQTPLLTVLPDCATKESGLLCCEFTVGDLYFTVKLGYGCRVWYGVHSKARVQWVLQGMVQ